MRRKRVVLALAIAASLAVGVLLNAPQPADDVPRAVTGASVAPPSTSAGAAVGQAHASPVLSSDAPPSRAARQGRRVAVRYTFDEGLAGPVRDAEGTLSLRVRTANGGSLATTPHGGGLAVRFPEPCPVYATQRCQRAVLQSGPAGVLNPGRAPFRFGASIQLAPNETSNGANILQKGYSVGDSQFKLQVDGRDGRPSCVLVGHGSRRIYVALSSLTVADGRWHTIECSRGDALLTIAVDQKTHGQTAIPPSLSIVNSGPLCIGGKGLSVNNDQFTGAIDDVFVTLDA
jgi:hypothetical protein